MKQIENVRRDHEQRSFSTSRTIDLFSKRGHNVINTQDINPLNNKSIISLTPIKKTFMKKLNHFSLAFIPKNKLNIPKTNSLLMKQNKNINQHIDLSNTLLSLGGTSDNDFRQFKTDYYLKYGKILESFKGNSSIIPSLSSLHKTKCQSLLPKLLKIHDESINLLFKNIKPHIILDLTSLKHIIFLSYESFSLMNQFQNELIKELINEKRQNEKAQQKIHDIEKYYSNEIPVMNRNKSQNDFNATSQTTAFENDSKNSKLLKLQREDSKKMLNIQRIEEE